jgi:hypothetical protein
MGSYSENKFALCALPSTSQPYKNQLMNNKRKLEKTVTITARREILSRIYCTVSIHSSK